MRPFPLLAAAVLLSAAFAGCFGSDGGSDGSAVSAPLNETDEEPLEAVDDGSAPMDVDVGHQPHIHDYWSGRERATLMDEEIRIDEPRAFMFTFFNVARHSPAVGGTWVQLPDGAIVYEGSGKLDFTATWTEPTITGLAMQYRDAASTEYSEPMPLQSGETLTIDLTPAMTDMPHASTSRWSFLLLPDMGEAAYGSIHIKIDVVKVGDISVFPGHPELFNGANTLTLFEGAATSSQENFALRALGFITGGASTNPEEDPNTILSEKVVPMETLTMTANVTITDVRSTTGEAAEVWFLYKPADTTRYFLANKLSGDFETGEFQFAWPVEMSQTDSPYGQESAWRFTLRVGTQTSGVGGPCAGCSDVQVEYEAAIVAYDSRLPEAGEARDGRG